MTLSAKRRLKHAGVVGVLLILASVLSPYVAWVQRLERASVDFRYRYFNRAASASDEVIVIDIDEPSLKILSPFYGRWPWPRRVYKELLSFLAVGEPKRVLFDILFTERMLGTDDDLEFFGSSFDLGTVSHGINLLEERADGEPGLAKFNGTFPTSYAVSGESLAGFPHPRSYLDAVVHTREILRYVNRLHVATFREDDDGVFRRAPILFKLGETWLSSLALAGLSLAPDAKIRFDQVLEIEDGSRRLRIPIDHDGVMPVHYYRPGREPKSVSIATVFDAARRLQLGEELPLGAVSPFEFKDKTIIVGASAVGLSDLKITPIRSAYPGALVQATAVANILSQDFLKKLPMWLRPLVAISLSLGCLLAILFFDSFWLKISALVGLYGGFAGISILSFQRSSWDVSLALPLLVASAGAFEAFIFIGVVEGREKRRMQSTLSKYLSPDVTKTLIESGQDPHAEDGRQQDLTILFTDIRSFTTISEAHPAPVVVKHLNQYLGRMTEIVFDEAGTLDKFVGDAIMAFWGAPLNNEKHAESAVRCALKMQEAVSGLRHELGEDSPFAFHTGVGVNTGTVVVGNIGSSKRLDYTVIGDNVNLAARIESVTKDFRSPILIGETTFDAVKDSIVCRLIDEHVQIKGKLQYIKLFQPLCERLAPDVQKFLDFAGAFANAVTIYRAGNFDAAHKLFVKLEMGWGSHDGPCQLYAQRCRHWIEHPPKDWSGYDTYSTKH